ncbi:MAG: hypothetical protein WBC48_01285 [Minisyncoccales bacterium]
MTIIETLAKIDPMLYASMFLLPFVLYGYLVSSKSKKRIAASLANPADQLREKKINIRKEITASLFLGGSVAFAAAIIIIIGFLVMDFKNSRGLFAVPLPAATFPPAPSWVYPSAPEKQAEAPAAKAVNDVKESEGFLID